MQRPSRPEGVDFPPLHMQRSTSLSGSFSGDRTSISASTASASPPPVSPDPAYIAASAASQIVTSDHQSQIDDWFDESGGKIDAQTIIVSPASLVLINGFLDQLLFSILAFSRSTSIPALRPAVSEVLKPRLAKDAINGADVELEEFLGGAEVDEISSFHAGQEPEGKWDLNLVWRRTRLRCMVYTRLGDMEEEDEDMYIERERLEDVNNADRRLSRELGIISPPAAIFLTSILEFIGEHALMVAGEAASNRVEIKQHRGGNMSAPDTSRGSRLAVEDIDVEKLAFNTTLGRLWRSWKKRVRAPSVSSIRPLSREVVRRRALSTSASPSISEIDDPSHLQETVQRPTVNEMLEEEHEPAGSVTEAKVLEHAVRDNMREPPEDEKETNHRPRNRPHSMMVFAHPSKEMSLSFFGQPFVPEQHRRSLSSQNHSQSRKRSSSLPPPGMTPYRSLLSEQSESSNTPGRGQRTPSPFCPDRANDQANLSSFQENPSSVSEDESTSDVNAQIAPDHSGAIDLGTLSGYTGPLSSAMMSPHDRQEHPLETQKDMGEGEHVAQAPAIVFIQGGGTSKRLPRPTSQELALHDNIIVKEGTPLYPIGVNDPNAASERSRDVQDESIYAELSGNHQSGKYGEQGPDMPHQDLNRSVLLDDGASTATLEKLQGQNSWAETSDTIPRKDKSLIHDAASIPRSDPLSLSPASNRELRAQEDVRSTPTKTSSHASGTEHGIPSLTPLRELMETAHDTSDDSSSFGPSHDVSKPENITPGENFGSNDLPNPDLFSSSTFLPLQRPSGGNKRFDLRKELPPVNTTGVERAAVQRINPSPALIKEASAHLTRTSVSSNRDVRPHTAASGTSQISQKIKGLIARESVDGGNTQPRLRRNSSEGSTSTTSDRFSGKAPKTLNKQQSFEQLIKSDETIQYTLTPKNMRDMELTESSMPNTRQQPKKVPMANIQRNNESPAVDPRARQTPNHSISSPKGINGLRANPSPGSNKEGGTSGRRHVSQSDTERSQSPLALRNGSIVTTGRSSVSGSVSTNGRPSHIEPRDARAKKETTSEIADFIRSTGPEMISHQPMPPPFNSALPILSQKLSGSHMDQPRLAGKQYPVVSARVLTIGASKKTRSKLQARDPTVSYDGETSDLIDFIRQGPALDRTDGGHRIPRSVAPFRRTMDSDEIHALDQGKARESISVASTQDSLAPTKSVHSSSNSRTGLLEKPGRSNIRSSPLVASKAPRLDEPPHPVRKRYRAKDPYLVDSDDEGGDENHLSKPQKHEETIIDFLRAASPAVKTSIPSAFDGVPKPQRNSVQKKTSEPNMREKFDRTTSSQSSKTTESKITIGATSTSSSTRRSRGAPQLPPLTARETSPHLITQNGTKLDSYLPTSPTYAAHVDRERGGPRRGHPQPRAEREPDSGLSDLADFFRNSGPPSPPIKKVPAMVYPKKQKEESGFGRIFSRKKRLAVRT